MFHPNVQAIGLGLIGVGAWLEVSEQSIVAAVEQQAFLVGPYLIIVAGIAIVLVAFFGVIGASCDGKFNRVLLVVVCLCLFTIQFMLLLDRLFVIVVWCTN